MTELHGEIVAGRWKGTRGAMVKMDGEFVIIRPFNDTAPTEDARMHLSPTRPIRINKDAWEFD